MQRNKDVFILLATSYDFINSLTAGGNEEMTISGIKPIFVLV